MLYDRDKVMSAEIAYTFENRVFFAHGTFDPAYAELSPGTINSSRLIKFFHGKGFAEGDFLAGWASYNNPWAYRIQNTANIIIRRMGWRNCYYAFVLIGRKIGHKLKHLLRQKSLLLKLTANRF
jgi:CelD/BcsL family acetyltransferase involved in cellulose biosynthesis